MKKAVVLHGEIKDGASHDELDTLVQAEFITRTLKELGHKTIDMDFSLDVKKVVGNFKKIKPDFVFNLVEAVDGQGRLIHLAPSVLDYLGIPYTGAGCEAMYCTSNKLLSKKILKAAGINTADFVDATNLKGKKIVPGTRYIIKSVWEHASIGINDNSIIEVKNASSFRDELIKRAPKLWGECYAELFIDGREFNLSVLGGEGGCQVLPPAEIIFEDYPPDKIKIVDYRAKWIEDSFEYAHTPRTFDFPKTDKPLLRKLKTIAEKCWRLFGLRGYARVDFRVDAEGTPYVLEINANPCLSPEGGFHAATQQVGLEFTEVVRRIINDSLRPPI